MPETDPKVDEFFASLEQWRDELAALRRIALRCGLTEAYKWRQPCYTYQDSNVAILGAFKSSCTLSFFKGALLKDPQGILTKPGENTRAARVARFTSVSQIETLTPLLESYLRDAIRLEQEGARVDRSEGVDPEAPAELDARPREDPALKAAFEALTPGRQRAYLMHFAAAKQSSTRTARIDKCAPRILDGKGLNDCTCGHTQKPPGCDGSHKHYR
ncbi:hypothetical protein KOR34_09850 [Posidoniimonas corsicana]|uniref:YdhG-like domain-containing protein n=1 Tax=Posidoniimonas corsicana TaxID=1938618 RepID=A0A5C5VBV2_9BACT|nr:DUF1801 domain-containing protein [Posidoniimonas corsicana]TWT36086.1 hypothetical protein KOR34_09850 [Posidoniimonas corsicana]